MDLKITNKYYFEIVLGNRNSFDIACASLVKMGCLLGENSPEKLLEYYQLQPFKKNFIIALPPSDNDFILKFELYTIAEHSINVLKMFMRNYIENDIKKKQIKIKSIYIDNSDVFGRVNLYESITKNKSYFIKKHFIPLFIIFIIFIISGLILDHYKFINFKVLEIIYSSLIGISITVYYAIKQETL